MTPGMAGVGGGLCVRVPRVARSTVGRGHQSPKVARVFECNISHPYAGAARDRRRDGLSSQGHLIFTKLFTAKLCPPLPSRSVGSGRDTHFHRLIEEKPILEEEYPLPQMMVLVHLPDELVDLLLPVTGVTTLDVVEPLLDESSLWGRQLDGPTTSCGP